MTAPRAVSQLWVLRSLFSCVFRFHLTASFTLLAGGFVVWILMAPDLPLPGLPSAGFSLVG